jgi:hypothetical protein
MSGMVLMLLLLLAVSVFLFLFLLKMSRCLLVKVQAMQVMPAMLAELLLLKYVASVLMMLGVRGQYEGLDGDNE